ncbi:S1C family serine protease [Haloglomus litoreum]|uniref:S1C family serine protease n=1 Tax=Haloglomus litoreum TaxID=3034026 RepID=UPI0023E8F1C3|nr:trypsin-like peptidase domain-containing protein [Haloglomus sp. DT116]
MRAGPPDYERLYRDTIPSVVSIYLPVAERGGAGSGFVYDRGADGDGHVVTNEHVVGDGTGDGVGTALDLRFHDGTWRTGEVVGTDPYTDLAVVAVPDLPTDSAPLALAEAAPAPGTPVAALGNPMGLDGSITAGIVSGAGRSMATGGGYAIPDTVQTDAPINPGNSGGPLVTADGTVVGVNRARAGDNIGFAVSAGVVRRVAPALVADGAYRHPYLRIRTVDVSPAVAEANDLDEPRGVLVADVSLGPASGALVGCHGVVGIDGRQVPVGGDVIVAVDGESVDSHEELMRHLLLETAPGEAVALDLYRNGERVAEQVTLAERPRPARGGDPSQRSIPVR